MGPELKSKWLGESEENLRRIFRQARQTAPSVTVFDEIDAFAHQRGTYIGSVVEHSMVNQLLTEMHGFRRNEMVFVVGTTNYLATRDAAADDAAADDGTFELPPGSSSGCGCTVPGRGERSPTSHLALAGLAALLGARRRRDAR